VPSGIAWQHPTGDYMLQLHRSLLHCIAQREVLYEPSKEALTAVSLLIPTAILNND
jgi:hypothetical protein